MKGIICTYSQLFIDFNSDAKIRRVGFTDVPAVMV